MSGVSGILGIGFGVHVAEADVGDDADRRAIGVWWWVGEIDDVVLMRAL